MPSCICTISIHASVTFQCRTYIYMIFETTRGGRNTILKLDIVSSSDSVVSTVTWLGAVQPRKRGSVLDGGKRYFYASIPSLGSKQPFIWWVTGSLSAASKRPGREADRSPSCNTKIKNERTYTCTPQCGFMACTGTTLRLRHKVVT
jgi:hypothetical protein